MNGGESAGFFVMSNRCHESPNRPSTDASCSLLAASLLEIGFVVVLKFSAGFTRLVPGLLTGILGASSLYLLSQAARSLPIGTAYAMWTGIGSVGGALLGMFLFGESREPARWACLAVVIIGLIGLRFTTQTQ